MTISPVGRENERCGEELTDHPPLRRILIRNRLRQTLAVDHFVCVDVFLDHEISVVAFDHVFDIENFVARENTEPLRIHPQASIFGEGHPHHSHAACVRALADQVMGHVPCIIELHDPLVDVPKQNLVLREALLSAGHALRMK